MAFLANYNYKIDFYLYASIFNVFLLVSQACGYYYRLLLVFCYTVLLPNIGFFYQISNLKYLQNILL